MDHNTRFTAPLPPDGENHALNIFSSQEEYSRYLYHFNMPNWSSVRPEFSSSRKIVDIQLAYANKRADDAVITAAEAIVDTTNDLYDWEQDYYFGDLHSETESKFSIKNREKARKKRKNKSRAKRHIKNLPYDCNHERSSKTLYVREKVVPDSSEDGYKLMARTTPILKDKFRKPSGYEKYLDRASACNKITGDHDATFSSAPSANSAEQTCTRDSYVNRTVQISESNQHFHGFRSVKHVEEYVKPIECYTFVPHIYPVRHISASYIGVY